MRILNFKLVILLITIISTAQLLSAQSNITGVLRSEITSETIIGANLSFISPDSTQIVALQTNSKGEFDIDIPESYEKIILTASAIGYKPLSLLIHGDQPKLNLGTIYLSDLSVELDELTVSGAGMVQQIDKYIIIPSVKELKNSATTLDLLQLLQLPGLDIDHTTKTASVNGGGIMYQINGVPKSKAEVDVIDTNNILRIEYSNVPSIKYINQGVQGVINYILREQLTGGNLFESFSQALTCNATDNHFSFSLNHKKSQFSLVHSFSWRKYDDYIIESSQKYFGANGVINRESLLNKRYMKGYNNDFYATYTYMFDPKTVFNAKLSWLYRPGDGNSSTEENETVDNNLSENYTAYSNYDIKTNTPSLDLYFKKQLKNKQEIELNLVGSLQDTKNNRYQIDSHDDSPLLDDYVANVDAKSYTISSEVSYKKYLEKTVLRFGAQDKHSVSENKYTGSTEATAQMTSNNLYLYGEAQGLITNNFSYSLGTGLKMFYVDNHSNNHTFYNNITVGQLLYLPLKNLSFDYLIMYQPTNPSLSSMENVTQTYDDLNKHKGNPDLKPSNYFRNRLTVTYQKDKFWTRLWAIYDHTFNPLITDYYYEDDYFVTTTVNGDRYSKLNFQYDAGVEQLWKILYLSGSVYYNKYRSTYLDFNHTLDNITLKFDATVIYKNWRFSASYSPLKAKSLYGYNVTTTDSKTYLGAQYTWNNFTFAGYWHSMFRNHGGITTTESLSDVKQSNSTFAIKQNGNWIGVNIVYRLNFGKKYNALGQSLNNAGAESSARTVQE